METEFMLWVEKAENDVLCFHAQQMAEKYLKGYLISKKRKVEKIHDLISLLKQIEEFDSTFSIIRKELLSLNSYSVNPRYPDPSNIIDKREAEEAFAEALTIANALGGLSTRVQLEVNTAALQLEKRDFEEAKRRCDHAMALAEHLDDARANGEA